MGNKDGSFQRFKQVVIGTKSQPADDIRVFCSGCCKKNGHVCDFSQFAAKGKSGTLTMFIYDSFTEC